MKETSKCLEYYLDSKVYINCNVGVINNVSTRTALNAGYCILDEKNIEETKKDFPKKKFSVNVTTNSFGMYVITFNFENKKTWFSKIILYFKRKKTLMLQDANGNKKENFGKEKNRRLEKAYKNQYGKYKSTGIYKPY